jgi:tetratricopeptide (TPR) repeat protein
MGELTIYRFQPDAMDRDKLEKIFVGDRQKQLLERLYEEVKEAAKARKPKYYLIVGPRGIGKTHFITLLYYRLSGVEEVFPVKLSEEEFSVYRVSDLLQRVLEVAKREKSILNQFRRMSDDDVVVASLGELKGLDKSLIIFLENLDQVFGKQMDEGEVKRFRSLLQMENMFMVVATAPYIFPEVSSHGAPFFNFFEIVHIVELTRDELKELLRRLAELDENKDFLRGFGKLEHRIDAIATLTGGNPRIAILLYDLTKVGTLLDVEKAFFRILDDYTPYYQDLFKTLSGEQRRIFDELISMGRPATPKELAARARLPQNVVNSQLRRLERDGFVISHRVGKQTKYEVKDKLFRLWRELRKEPFGRERISILIKFLEVWYSVQERFEMLTKYAVDLGKLDENKLREMNYWLLSLPIEYRQQFLFDILIEKCAELGKEQILESLALDETEKAISKIRVMIKKGEYEEALKAVKGESAWQNTPLPLLVEIDILVSQGKIEEAFNVVNEALKLNSNDETAWDLKGAILLGIGRLEDALQASQKAIEINPKYVPALDLQSLILERLGKIDESLGALEKAIDLSPNNSKLWRQKGELLLRIERYEEALEAFSKALELNPLDARAWNRKGLALRRTEKEKQAQEAFLKVLFITDQSVDVDLLEERAYALMALRNYKDAASVALKAASLTQEKAFKQYFVDMAVYSNLRDSHLELRKNNIGNAIVSLRHALQIIQEIELTEQQAKTTIKQLIEFLVAAVYLRNVGALRVVVDEISNALESMKGFPKEFLKPFKVAIEIVETEDINKYYDVQMELRDIVAKTVSILVGSDRLAPPKEQKP